MLEKIFKLSAHDTSVRTEVVAGLTTFLAMAYIVFVNPSILSTPGMDVGAVTVATCLAAAIGCFIMAFYANWPVGMAPGMGLNAFFAFTVVAGMGWHWQVALGAVFISGCVFILLTVTGIRRWIVQAIPSSLQTAIPAGIGMFLALIALSNAGIVVKSDATKVTLGALRQPETVLAILGFFLIAALDYLKVRGAILLGILAVTMMSMMLGYTHFQGLVSTPPSIAPTFFQMDIGSAAAKGLFNVVVVFVLVEVFDATGSLTGIARKAGLMVTAARPRLMASPPTICEGMNRALVSDSASILCGAMFRHQQHQCVY